ncbi:MAG: hypothetical protein R3Y53_08335 [Bacillota bacterium]
MRIKLYSCLLACFSLLLLLSGCKREETASANPWTVPTSDTQPIIIETLTTPDLVESPEELQNEDTEATDVDETETDETDEEDSESPLEEDEFSVSVPSENLTDEPTIPGDTGAETTVPVTPEKTQSEEEKPFWQTESSRQLNNLISVASAAQTNYTKSGAPKGWYSNGGKMWNYYEDRQITVNDLVANSYLESGLVASEYELLLLKGSDLVSFNGLSVPQEARRFGAFAAMKIDDKYLIASPYGRIGYISVENYASLLALYNSNHGTVQRLSSAAQEYGRILNYISLFEGSFENYFVREIRVDSKYAVVVFSTTKNTADIRQYILRNDTNFWEVVVPDSQYATYPITTINQLLPDFNLNLLPTYHIASWQTTITESQGGAIAALFQIQAINSVDDIYYQCATNVCSYVVLNNKDAYVCFVEDGVWKAQKVLSDYEARNVLRSKTDMDYGFLILDD